MLPSTHAEMQRFSQLNVALVQKLLNECKQFHQCTDPIKKNKLRGTMLKDLKTILGIRDRLLKDDITHDAFVLSDYTSFLEFLYEILQSLHKYQSLTADFLKWCIADLLFSRSDKRTNNLCGVLLQSQMLLYFRLMSRADINVFVSHIISQLVCMIKDAQKIFIIEPSEDVPAQYLLDIPVLDADSKIIVYHSLLSLLQHGPVEFEHGMVSENDLFFLWTAMIKIYSIDDIPLQTTCVLFWHRLFGVDRGYWVMSRLVFAKMLAMEKLFLSGVPYGRRDEVENLKNAHSTCFAGMTELLARFDETQSFGNKEQGVSLLTIIKWACEASQYFLEYTDADIPDRLEKIVCTVCGVLSALDLPPTYEKEWQLVRELTLHVHKIVDSLLRRSKNDEVIGQLVKYLSYLLNLDESTSTTEQCEWVRGLLSRHHTELQSANRTVDSIQLTRRVAVALSRCDSDLVASILPDLLPTQAYLIKCVSNASAQLLLALVQLVGDMSLHPSTEPAVTVAFLSFPWLTDPDFLSKSDFKRHHNSLPFMRELSKYVKSCAANLTDAVRESTLAPLARMRAHSEWRRSIILYALRSKRDVLVQSALSNMAVFVASSKVTSFAPIVRAALELDRSEVDFAAVLHAVSQCVCATTRLRGNRSEDEENYSLVCRLCQQVASGESPPADAQLELSTEISQALFTVLSAGHTEEIQIRIETAALLSTMMCHCVSAASLTPETLSLSLQLMMDLDEDVRNAYVCAFKVLVSTDRWVECFREQMMSTFVLYKSETEMDRQLQNALAIAPFLGIAARYSADMSLRNWSLVQYVRIIIGFGEKELNASLHLLIKDLCATQFPERERESERYKKLFSRSVRALSEGVVSEMLETVQYHTERESDPQELDDNLEDQFMLIAKVFLFENIDAMLRVSGAHLVCCLLLCEPRCRDAASIILIKIRRYLDVTGGNLLEQFIPMLISQRVINRQDEDYNRDFVEAVCGASEESIMMHRRHLCNVHLLNVLSVDESHCLELMYKINNRHLKADSCTPNSLTKIMKHRCEYLGLLLNFRCILLDDDVYFEMRDMLLASLASMIKLFSREFVDSIAQKLLVVLCAATQLGEKCIPPWIVFVQQLDAGVLASLLPQILISIQPLLHFDATNELLDVIFEQKGPLAIEQSESFERTALVLIRNENAADSSRIGEYLRRSVTDASREKVIIGCVRMLLDECETVGLVVLRKLQSLLDGDLLEDSLVAQLVPALLHTMRRCGNGDVRLLAAKCLGRLGAVDPGRLGLSLATHRHTASEIVFVDDPKFFVDLLEGCWRVYAGVLQPFLVDQIEYCIQELLRKLVGAADEKGIFKSLSAECQRDIIALRGTQLSPSAEDKFRGKIPIVSHVNTFNEWLRQCFLMGADKVRQHPMSPVFRALKWLTNIHNTVFTRQLLPQLIIRLIIECHEEMIEMYCSEMEQVLRRVMSGEEAWVQMAAHIVFSILDTLERYAIARETKKKESHKELERVHHFVSRIMSLVLPDGSFLVVAAAEKCQCLYRALRWCEQHAIAKDANGDDIFSRQHFYTLERIYTQLQYVDGVMGAFECLAAHTAPSPDERILALEAIGDYNEALPLYARSTDNKELKLIKCLLRLNQPQLALNTAMQVYEQFDGRKTGGNKEEEELAAGLVESQMEAAWHLRDWPRLEKMDKTSDLTGKNASWGAVCASIMCAVKQREPKTLAARLQSARQKLVDRLTVMTIEHSDTYAQAYKYITQLHILEEVDSSTAPLCLLDNEHTDGANQREADLRPVITKWQVRSDNAVQCASVLEPILRVRRELLEASKGKDSDKAISQLLIQSCRLARQAGHLQIAWTFLVEAKALEVNYKEVGMEEARFEFQKGNEQQAIGLLSKLLSGRFSKMSELFSQFVSTSDGSRTQGTPLPELVQQTSREERAAFAEVQLLRAEYMLKAGAAGSNDLFKIYTALRQLDVPSEDLFYRVAVFCDGIYSMDSDNARTDLVISILKTYSSALKHGRTHMFHAMPRMLTLWLDFTQKKTDMIAARAAAKPPVTGSADMDKRDTQDITKMNSEILAVYRQLDSYAFYTAFPQLVSRIVHSNETVFQTLKVMLADLICKYPHQCLWQSIAVYRTGPWGKSIRQERCTQVYQVATKKDRRIEQLIDQYDYIAAVLIRLAESQSSHGSFSDLPRKYPELHNFFTNGTLDCSLLMGAKERKLSGNRKVTPSVMIPLTEMLEHALPTAHETKVSSLTQFVVPADSPDVDSQLMSGLPEVFIQSIDNNYIVLKSLQRPKRLTVRGADGRTFQIMCKPVDELRKDARFMDFNRMMNSLMRQNADARRRQLMVRTFSVIPLQSAGGILEWVPNLAPYRSVLQPLCEKKSQRPLTDNDWFGNWDSSWPLDERVAKMRSFFYKSYPLVMSEWFRRQFADPASWHAARSGFARSSAVMSMIGFVLGLGDRHGENMLLDVNDGCVVHVDFNLIFNKGESLPVKEVTPFRLTRNMVNGLGPTGVEGSFRKASEAALRVMRDNKDTLLTVIGTFVHDPLLEWITFEARAQQNKGRQRAATAVKAVDQANDAIGLIAKRLDGHIVTPDVYKWKYNCAPMGLEGQTGKLIEMATDERLLAQMYIGWAPFL